MTHKITIQTTKGQLDSLKRDVNIVFTLTPKQVYGPACNLVTFAGIHFPKDSDANRSIILDGDVAFGTYEPKECNGGKKKCALGNDRSPIIPVGMASRADPPAYQWAQAYAFSAGCSVVYVGPSGSRGTSLVKRVTCQGVQATVPILTWPTGHNVGVYPGFLLQALVVEDPNSEGTILDPHDSTRPLFAKPLDCDSLPEVSAWMLTEDDDGLFNLEKTDAISNPKQRKDANLLELRVETLTKAFSDMKNQVDTLVNSLGETQQHLLSVEETVGKSRVELREVQVSLATNQDEISRRDSQAPDVIKLAASCNRAEERLAALEVSATKAEEEVKALAGGRSGLARLGASVQSTQKQISLVDASLSTIVHDRVSAVESKTSDLDESLSHIQDQLSAARTAAGTARDRVDRLNRGVLAVQATADTLKASADQDQERLSTLEEKVGRVHQRLDAVEKSGGSIQDSAGSPRVADVRRQSSSIRRPSSPAQDSSAAADESLNAIRRQVMALDRRIPVVEAKMDRMEKSIVIMERRLPAVEAKALRAEKLCEGTQDELAVLQLSLATSSEELVGLVSRVADVEMKTNRLGESWDESEPPSPGVFPSQSHLSPL